MADDSAVCAVCGKPILPAPEVRVREGEKQFHLECFRLYKHQTPPQPPNST